MSETLLAPGLALSVASQQVARSLLHRGWGQTTETLRLLADQPQCAAIALFKKCTKIFQNSNKYIKNYQNALRYTI